MDSVKLDVNRKSFDKLSPGIYTYRVRTITPMPVADKPEAGLTTKNLVETHN
jgi:hypothetical protein